MKFTTIIGAAALAFLTPAVAMAADIDTTRSAVETIAPFGSPNTATYGQTFTVDAGDTVLNSFSLFLNGASSALNFRGYVATWDGAKAGTLLYSSADRLLNSSAANQEYFFAPLLAVTPGARYVAFLSVSQMGAQSAVTTSMPYSSADVQPGGSFVYSNNGTDFASLFTTGWSVRANNDVAFKADFGTAAGAVPEPAAWAMMIAGFGLVGFAVRRQARQTQVRFAA